MSNKDLVWPADESKMGKLIYSKDWSETSLGAISDWPQSLHAALNMCLISNSPISICWGEELIFLYNDAWGELHGDDHTAALGQPARKVFEDNWDAFHQGFKRVLSEGEVAESKNQLISFGDGEFLLDFSFSPIPDENGSVSGIFSIATKTEGHAPADKNLKSDEQELAGFYENAFIGLHWLGPDGIVLRANPTVLNMLGYSRDEFVGHHISDFHADKDTADEILQKSSANEELHDYECRLKCRDGSIRHVLISTDIYRAEGELVHTRCFVRDITHRKHAGAELMRKVAGSEHRKSLNESAISRDLIYIFDLDYRLIFVNDALLDLWGRTLEETIGKNLFEVGYELWHAEMHEREIERVIDTKQPVQGELSLQHEIIGLRRYDYSFVPVLDDKGDVEAVAGTIRDITDHKQIERALRKSEEKYRTLFETIDKGFCIIDVEFDENDKPVDWHYLETNQGYEKHTGLENVVGKDASEILPNLGEEQVKTYGKVLRTGEPAYFESYNKDLERWFEISAYRIGGLQEGKVAVLVDNITERKQKELTNALLSAIVKNSDDAIISKDLNSIITSWNQGAERIFGYTAGEAVGRPITMLFPEDRIDEEEEIIGRIRKGKRVDHFETVRKRKDGTLLDVSLTISPVKDSDGNIVGASKIARDITKRKEYEYKNALLSAIVKSSDDAIVSKDLNSIITSWNQGAERMFGYTAEEAVGRPITMLFPEDRIDEEEEIIGRIREGKRVDHFETVRKRKDGTLLDVSLTISPVKDSDGNIVGASKIARDITKRKEYEYKNALLSAIVKSSDDAIVSKDLNSIITSWNQGAERIFGYTAEEAVGRPITMLFPEDRIDEEEEIIGRIREGKRVDHFETVRKRKDGTLLDVSLTISPVKDSDGNIVGASKIARDITEQKQVEQKLRKSRNRLRTVLEIGTVGVVFWGGEDFTITEVNDAFLEMTGLTREEAIGKDWRELTPEEFYPVSQNAVADLKETGHTEPYEKQYIRKDGSRWWGLSAPRRIDDNEVVEFLLDITERKEAEEELQEINETLEERVEERTEALLSYQDQLRSLASQLSKAEEQERQRLATELHDNLGQMLTLSKMKVDILKNKQFSESVASDINRLQELMDDALTYTRKLMSDLKPPPSIEGEDLRASIRWIVKQMEKHDLEISVKDDDRPKPVDDEVKITLLQCVRELLFNVLKHTSEKEAVIDLRRIDDYLQIKVTDEGEGFDNDNKELSPDQQGGFGLFNIRERIDLLGGRFDINSELGRGTEVTLHIPLKEKDQISEAIEQTKEVEQIRNIRQREEVGERIKVLLADDHQMVREGLRKIIEDHDDIVVVAEAADGKEAMELARETSPDIILMDVNMPVMDGIEATRKISAEMPDVHIIGLSLHDDEDVITDMRSAGASAYLTKTEALESLIVTVRSEASAPKR